MVGPKDKKKIDSDDDRSSVGSVNGKISDLNHEISRRSVQKSNYFFLEFDFDEDDTTLGIDLGKDKILMEPAKRKEKKEPEKVF